MSSEDYLTDASSLDALSNHGDLEEVGELDDHVFPLSPTTPIKLKLDSYHHHPHSHSQQHQHHNSSSSATTPTPLFSLLDIRTPVVSTPTVYHSEPKTAYFVGNGLSDDLSLLSALKELGIQPSSEKITESSVNSLDCSTSIIIFSEFSGSLFESLRRRFPSQRPRIYGPSVILSCAQKDGADQKLPVNRLGYPIYSLHLQNCRVAATGFSSKEQLQEVRRKILYMGGAYQERMSEAESASSNTINNDGGGVVTHLIADKCRGVKYQDAVYLGKPILTPDWIDHLWKHRDNIYYDWTLSMKDYRVKCFHACKIAFHGFAPQEKAEMTKLVLENGGTVVEPDDPQATHIVESGWLSCSDSSSNKGSSITTTPATTVSERQDTPTGRKYQQQNLNQTTPNNNNSSTVNFRKSISSNAQADFEDAMDGAGASPLKRARLDVINDLNESEVEAAKHREFGNSRAKVLKVEWFWNSVQIEACSDEKLYLIEGRSSAGGSNNRTLNASLDLDQTITSPNFGNSMTMTTPSFLSPQSAHNFNISDTDVTPKSGSGTPGSIGKRKRKRMREYVSALAQVEYPRFISEPMESSKGEDSGSSSFLLPSSSSSSKAKSDGVPNLGGNSLDQSQVDEKNVVSDAVFAHVLKELSIFFKTADLKNKTRRYIEFYQLLETERNYVTVLMNIVKIFKEPCENEEQTGGRILSTREINTIFSTILPIYTLHRRLLRDLFQLQNPWNEENLIGKVYYEYAKELKKVYEPFVNFFESVKAEIARCEAEKPRFLALLRIAQCKPECGKQSLSELIIRPVQRLPSTALILSNLEKHTPKGNPDAEWLTKGSKALNLCIQSLNEEKARNEARLAIFEAFAEIDGCPAKTISDHRTILMKFDVTALTDLWGAKFEPITLFVYTDHVQVTKRRGIANVGSTGSSKGGSSSSSCSSSSGSISSGISVANLRSPSISRKSFVPGSMMNPHNTGGYTHHQKKYKFYEWIEFTEIRRVLDVYDTTTPSFAFVVRGPRDLRERILVFTCPDDVDWPKEKLLVFMAKQLANAVNRVDFENLIAKADSASLNVNENSSSVLEKAARFATKTRHKVGRALSLNRTPSKLKRTMSQMMSPFTTSRRRLNPDKDKDSDTMSLSQFSDDSPPRPQSNKVTPRVPTFSETQ